MIPRVINSAKRYVRGLSPDGRAGLFGLGWSYFTHVLLILLRFGSSLLLTRLLVPEVYGVFGPAMAVTILLELLSDIGLRPAVIKSSRGEEATFLGTAWSVGVVRSLLLASAVFGLSWVLPPWYNLPELQAVLWAFTVRPMLFALQNPTLFVLYKRLNYRTPFFIDLGHSLTGLVATLLLCWWLRNVWGLVLGLLIGDFARVIVTHLLCPRSPWFCWDRTAAKELTHFGVPVFMNTMVYGAWIYFDRLGGPRVLPPDQMGLYITAWSLAEALDNLIARAGDVFYGLLSRQQTEARRPFFAKTLRRVTLALCPLMIGWAILAPFVYRLLFDVKFHGAGILLGLLVARLIPRLVAQVQFMYLLLQGQVTIATRAYLVSLAVQAVVFVPLVHEYGVLGIALGAVLAMTMVNLAQAIQMAIAREAPWWPSLVATACAALAVAGILATH